MAPADHAFVHGEGRILWESEGGARTCDRLREKEEELVMRTVCRMSCRPRLAAALLAAGTGMWLPGCGGGGGGSGSPANASLVGTWKTTAIRTASGQQANCPASFTLAPTVFLECSANDVTTLNADGTIPGSGGVTYSVSGNRITLNSPAVGADAAYSSTFTFSLSGTQLTLTQVSSTSPDPTLGSDYNGSTTIYQRQ